MVPEEGVEPTHPCGYWILSPARLPVPPLRAWLFYLFVDGGRNRERRGFGAERVTSGAAWLTGCDGGPEKSTPDKTVGAGYRR
jgi:hypothetical protein